MNLQAVMVCTTQTPPADTQNNFSGIVAATTAAMTLVWEKRRLNRMEITQKANSILNQS